MTVIDGTQGRLVRGVKASFETTTSPEVPKVIWTFSDMVNETPELPMPELRELGPERMLERARANGLLV